MLNQLVRIYNTMTTISTKGEDTLIMADCLRALRDVVMQMQQQQETGIEVEVADVKIGE